MRRAAIDNCSSRALTVRRRQAALSESRVRRAAFEIRLKVWPELPTNLDRLQRRQAALGLDVGVAHVMADHGADTGEFAATRHLKILKVTSAIPVRTHEQRDTDGKEARARGRIEKDSPGVKAGVVVGATESF